MFNSGISGVDIIKSIRKIKLKTPIIIDGGVRRGSDVIKYLCLGANLVGLGRPIIYGLICDGRKGVANIYKILKSEIQTCMINGGFKNLSDFKLSRLNIDK